MKPVRVKWKGQVTIPVKVRRQYEIEEGDLLTLDTKDSRTIIMRKRKTPEPGQPVGSKEQRRILRDLEKLRKNWR